MVFMSVVLLLIRSNKMTEYEQGLSAAGNYNYIVVDAGKQDVEKIKKSGLFSGIGMIKREGTVAITGNEIKLVSADKNSIAMYHLSCLEGRYPKEQDEIAAPYDFFKKMGIVPKIGRLKKNKEYFDSLVESLSIQDILHKYPHQLSGGQQQRVAIARALYNQPKMLLCDEPTGNLDKETGADVMNLLNKIQKQYHTTVIIVTHDPDIAKCCQRIITLSDGKVLR